MNAASPHICPYWELPREDRRKLLRWNLLDVLALVTEGEIGPEEFDQELAIQLNSLPETVLFENGTFRNLKHRKRFHATQKKTFLTLIAPYRWKKRDERLVSYSDHRWQDDPNQPGGRRLVREVLHLGPAETAQNREEERAAVLIDLMRAWETLEKSYPEPIVLAAIGALSRSDAVQRMRVRKSAVLALIREAKGRLAALELPE